MEPTQEFTTADLRKCATTVFLACEEIVAKDIAERLKWAADQIDRLTMQEDAPLAELNPILQTAEDGSIWHIDDLEVALERVNVLEKALRMCSSELWWCKSQLAAKGNKGRPGDSVSKALDAAGAALTPGAGT